MSMHKARPEDAPRKPDCSKNGTDKIKELMEQQREKEKHMYPIRINKNTVVYRINKRKN